MLGRNNANVASATQTNPNKNGQSPKQISSRSISHVANTVPKKSDLPDTLSTPKSGSDGLFNSSTARPSKTTSISGAANTGPMKSKLFKSSLRPQSSNTGISPLFSSPASPMKKTSMGESSTASATRPSHVTGFDFEFKPFDSPSRLKLVPTESASAPPSSSPTHDVCDGSSEQSPKKTEPPSVLDSHIPGSNNGALFSFSFGSQPFQSSILGKSSPTKTSPQPQVGSVGDKQVLPQPNEPPQFPSPPLSVPLPRTTIEADKQDSASFQYFNAATSGKQGATNVTDTTFPAPRKYQRTSPTIKSSSRPARKPGSQTGCPTTTKEFEPLHVLDAVSRNRDVYQCLTFAPSYLPWSFEELRLADYRKANGKEQAAAKGSIFGQTHLKSIQAIPSATNEAGMRKEADSSPWSSSRTITIDVGISPPTQFTIHESLLLQQSDFFRQGLKRKHKESQEENPVVLHTDDPSVFRIWAAWLYSGHIYTIPSPSPSAPTSFSNDAGPDPKDSEFRTLVEAYILALKLKSPHFQNAIIDAFVEKVVTEQRIDIKLTKMVYGGTRAGDPLRRLLLDVYLDQGGADWIAEREVDGFLSEEFLRDFTLALLVGRESEKESGNNDDDSESDSGDESESENKSEGEEEMGKSGLFRVGTCRYHVHEDGKRCC